MGRAVVVVSDGPNLGATPSPPDAAIMSENSGRGQDIMYERERVDGTILK